MQKWVQSALVIMICPSPMPTARQACTRLVLVQYSWYADRGGHQVMLGLSLGREQSAKAAAAGRAGHQID